MWLRPGLLSSIPRLLLVPLMLGVAGCATTPTSAPEAVTSPMATPATAPTINADEVAGSWGFASYHQDAARARTEAMARTQCRQPYVIRKGPNGGVVMHLADAATPEELALKGGPGGKNFIGPAGDIGDADREVVSLDRQGDGAALARSQRRGPLRNVNLCAVRRRAGLRPATQCHRSAWRYRSEICRVRKGAITRAALCPEKRSRRAHVERAPKSRVGTVQRVALRAVVHLSPPCTLLWPSHSGRPYYQRRYP